MPTDSSGNYELPAGSTAVTGQTAEASQHNTPINDIAAALTARVTRNGTAPMLANLPMGGFKVTGAGNGSADTDVATVGQVATVVSSTITAATTKATPVDADSVPIVDSAASDTLKRVTWANVKATLKTYLDTLYAPLTRTISAGGLATGGGTLASDRTITVTAASQGDAEAGTATTVAMTPQRTAQAIAALGYSYTPYSGSDDDYLNFPVGQVLATLGTAVRNSTVTVWTGPTTNFFQLTSGTLQLTGTWKARGQLGSGVNGTLVERIA